MRRKLRFVFDTNVLVSALLFEHSKPSRAVEAALQHGDLLISAETMQELADVLRRDQFDRYVKRSLREAYLNTLIRQALLLPVDVSIHACRDPKDDKFLELAVTGSSDFIVTGDRDLLVLNPFQGIAIVTPASLSEYLQGPGE
jgi:putative PIN family toxin of toxin-antitoxin system